MDDLNRIKQLAGLHLNESDLSSKFGTPSNISWNIEDDGMYVTGTWNGSQGPIEMLADGYETMDGYWKISVGMDGETQLTKDDIPKIKQAFVEWFKHAKNVDFGDDSKLSVDDVNVKIPSIENVSMRKFASEISRITGLDILGVNGENNYISIDLRNKPLPTYNPTNFNPNEG